MHVVVNEEGRLDQLAECLTDLVECPRTRGLVVLAADANGWLPEQIDPLLRSLPVPVLGGIFPALIHDATKMDRGFIVVGIEAELEAAVIESLGHPDTDFDSLLEESLTDPPEARTMLVFVDGFASRIGSFIESLFNVFGLDINYIGGGAGSLSFKQQPCLITNQGLLQDAAVLALLGNDSSVGVSHGWRSVAGPYQVTKSEGNVIHTLDCKPALEVYRDAILGHSGLQLQQDDFFAIAKSYPFGIAKMGSERIVRDPVLVQEDGSLVCVGEIPSGAFVDILHGDEDSLIEAAGLARQLSRDGRNETDSERLTLFIDCISRVLFLGDRFDDELLAVRDPSTGLVGACTIGEIANSGRDYLEFYNKTSVVAELVGS